ncbi:MULTISPECIES: M17 family metallopeptidase [unclassified Mycoplasma]|uniref:M17 family metallopeptidase n=1 Tax=unclassified Mycoplasma TaxID=2683645 RepID=UPI00211BAA54|nr:MULTISPECIES: leucyl aminopeptidase family protein [unclassified Mycoplasma]UUM19851.1 leucyl aminopeptidase family protein [Mycoplasma sp. 1578d]UUM24835.1 leucyl aminopeptidase family protein [Mycoplasma sp. 3686d]
MIKIQEKLSQQQIVLKVVFEHHAHPELVSKKHGFITEDLANNCAYLFIEKGYSSYYQVEELLRELPSKINRNYVLQVSSLYPQFSEKEALRLALLSIEFGSAKLFKKTHKLKEHDQEKQISLLVQNKNDPYLQELTIIANAITSTRNLQITPENFLNSEMLASFVASDFSGIENLKIKVLTKKEIKQLNMGLLLSVNKGSTHEPRVVIIEYNGNPESNEKTVYVGKGITFDTGGVNTKGYHMEGMKYDMSGSVIAAYAVKAIAQLKLPKNVSAIMCITDNRINGDASLPENVYQSMSGKWVEVADTDAEGRLVLADGLYYAADILKSTTIVSVATLTGAILTSLSNIYTGIFSQSDHKVEIFLKSAHRAKEKVWRMPMHKDFDKGNKSSKVADLMNWSSKVKQDSSQAAMFLKEFVKDVDFIHCDVAGTADINGEPQGVLVSTLIEFAKNL